MKILLVNHADSSKYKGGDSLQLEKIGVILSKRGHKVLGAYQNKPDVSGFDLVHIFNCRQIDSFKSQIEACKAADIKIVVSPIWISLSNAFWGSRASLKVLKLAVNKDPKASLAFELFKNREYILEIDKKQFGYNSRELNSKFKFNKISRLLDEVTGLLPNSWLELQAIRNDLRWNKNNFSVANYGVDPKIFLNSDPRKFREFTGIKYPFILQAGRIEPAKNQAMLCWALRNTQIPIVFIGSSSNWPKYAEFCQAISGEKLTIFDHMPPDLLASAYSAASVHILPSWCETCGLVSLEASLSGTPVIGSTFGHELEYLKENALYVDPSDPDSILLAVKEAWESGKNIDRVGRLRDIVLNQYSWEEASTKTESFYKGLFK